MKFTSIPDDLAPLGRPVVYAFNTETDPANVEVLALNPISGETIAAKRFFNTSIGSFNLARPLRSRITYAPEAGPTGFIAASGRTVLAAVKIGSQQTPNRRFFDAASRPKEAGPVTTMPRERIIARGESDEITILAGTGVSIGVTAESSGEPAPQYFFAREHGFIPFRLNTSDFEGASRLTVEIREQDTVIGTIVYTVVEPVAGSCRIAWRSAAGSIEHYTFPVETEATAAVERPRILTADGVCRSVDVRGEGRRVLLSAYEPQAVIEALGGIVAAPQVWIAEGGTYRPVDVTDLSATVRRHHTLPQMELHLRYPLNPLLS